MRTDVDRRTILGALRWITGAEEQECASRELCDAIIDTLGRDHALRHAYLRKRWQGTGSNLGDKGDSTAGEQLESRRRSGGGE